MLEGPLATAQALIRRLAPRRGAIGRVAASPGVVALGAAALLAGCASRAPAPAAETGALELLAGRLDAPGRALTLSPCGESEPLPLTGPAAARLLALADELGPGAHAELVVRRGADATHVSEVRFVAPESGSWCERERDGASLVASGNEPFWNVQWVGDDLLLRRPDQAPRRIDRASLRVEERPCRDSMSGAWHHLTASVVLEGEHLAGCARRLGEP